MTDFLRDLWRFKPEDSWILLWSLRTGRSEFFSNIEPTVEAVERLAKRSDVYVGVGLRAESLPPGSRGGTSDVSGIAALWLDVDVVDPVHQKVNLFASKDEAEHFVMNATPLAPSYIIDTGHGLQVWWLFHEPWMFADQDERRSAIDLSRKWSNTFRAKAHDQLLDIDAVHDLSRVLRIPGTYNYKDVERGGGRLPVTIRRQQYRGEEIARYSPADFEPYLLDSPEASDEIIDVGEFVINLMAEPPSTKFDLLSDTSVKFHRSWRHARPDLHDQSLSTYDMSLAGMAGRAGWSVQEVVNLIIAHRRRYGESGSHKNLEDYLRRTLRKCMPKPGTPDAHPDNPEISAPDPPAITRIRPTKDTEYGTVMRQIQEADSPTNKFGLLAGLLGSVEITGIIKYRTDPPSYMMDTTSGKIRFDKPEELTGQASFRNHVYAATGKMPPQQKRADWDDILNVLGDVMEEQDVANDATDEGIIASYLVHYLSDRPPTENDTDAFRNQSAFLKEGSVYIFGAAFRLWIYATYRHTLMAREFGLLMRNIGAKERTFSFTDGKKGRTSRYCWAVPDSVVVAVLGDS